MQSHPQRSFLQSNESFFVEKVRDIVRLYLVPQSVKKGGSAVRPCQDAGPENKAPLAGAAGRCGQRLGGDRQPCTSRHLDCLAYLRWIDTNVPDGLYIHLVVDN